LHARRRKIQQKFANGSQSANNERFSPKTTRSIAKDPSYDFMHRSILV
jgi:hypothetical protein